MALAGVFIMGCGRSGTSFMTAALKDNGYDPGNHDTLYHDPYITLMNERILEENSCTWYQPAPIIRYKFNRTELNIIIKNKEEPMVIKDSRLSLLYPLYRKHFPNFKVIVCFRNPVDCMISIVKQNPYLNRKMALHIWLEYNQRIFRWVGELGLQPMMVQFPELWGFTETLQLLGGNTYCTMRLFQLRRVHHSTHADVPAEARLTYIRLKDMMSDFIERSRS